jgi:hypothetical protein
MPNESKPFCPFQNRHVPFLRFMFLSFFQGALLSNFDRICEYELLMKGSQQLQDNCSVVSTNLHAWLNVLDLAAEGVSAERRNVGTTVLQIVLKAVHYVYRRALAVTVVK